jgi:hypothetical protein
MAEVGLVSRWIVPLLLGAVACSSPPPPRVVTRAPHDVRKAPTPATPNPTVAEPESCETVELPADPPERGRTLEVLLQTTTTERDAACVVRALERAYPGLTAQSPPPRRLPELRKWWKRVGYQSRRFTFGPDDLVVLPELPKRLSPEQRARLSPLLCGPVDPDSCGSESRAFLADAERQLWTVSELLLAKGAREATETDHESKVEECARSAEGRYGVWEACVRRLVPSRLVAPNDAFRLPEQGILETYVGGYFSPCIETRAYSVSSGLELTRLLCWMETTKTQRIRYRVERVDPRAAQRAALFIAIWKDLQTSPAYAESFTAPSGLEKRGRWHVSKRAALHPHVADAVELRYELHGVLGEPEVERLTPGWETQPQRRYLVQILHDASAPSCATPRDRAELTAQFEHLATVEENLEQTLESVACRQ